jgi:ArsR family transcriptional regulator, arsenate/arsenite/antimonite-responsive transcriptional repressor
MDREAEIFQSLADPTRLRLIHLLVRRGEICVCELVDALGLPQYNVSRHLRILQHAGWLEDRKVGKWVYYRIQPELPLYQRTILAAIAELEKHREDLKKDAARARRRLQLRRGGVCCVGLVSKIGAAPSPKFRKFKRRKVEKNR